MARESVLRMAAVFVCLAAIALISFFSIRAELNSKARGHGGPHLAELRRDFSRASPPPDAVLLGVVREYSKVGWASVDARYRRNPLQANALLDAYAAELLLNGWRSIGRSSTGRGLTERFCKNDYEATVTTESDPSLYDFSMTWSEISIAECSERLKN
jgi:hypothetical protein